MEPHARRRSYKVPLVAGVGVAALAAGLTFVMSNSHEATPQALEASGTDLSGAVDGLDAVDVDDAQTGVAADDSSELAGFESHAVDSDVDPATYVETEAGKIATADLGGAIWTAAMRVDDDVTDVDPERGDDSRSPATRAYNQDVIERASFQSCWESVAGSSGTGVLHVVVTTNEGVVVDPVQNPGVPMSVIGCMCETAHNLPLRASGPDAMSAFTITSSYPLQTM
jgi:hypothetical protein